MRIFLNEGEEVLLNEKQAEHQPKEMIRVDNGVAFVDRAICLRQCEVIAGVEYGLNGYEGRWLPEGLHQPAPSLSGQGPSGFSST